METGQGRAIMEMVKHMNKCVTPTPPGLPTQAESQLWPRPQKHSPTTPRTKNQDAVTCSV